MGRKGPHSHCDDILDQPYPVSRRVDIESPHWAPDQARAAGVYSKHRKNAISSYIRIKKESSAQCSQRNPGCGCVNSDLRHSIDPECILNFRIMNGGGSKGRQPQPRADQVKCLS